MLPKIIDKRYIYKYGIITITNNYRNFTFNKSLCLILLIRSGIQILFDHPKLYWTDDTKDDNHWLRFGKKIMPKDKLWTSLDEAEDPGLGSSARWQPQFRICATLALYNSYHLGSNGSLILHGFLLFSGQWQRLIPTDFGVFSRAIDTMYQYLTLNIPAEGATYNAFTAAYIRTGLYSYWLH